MTSTARPPAFWCLWLSWAAAGVIVFGLALVLAPGLALRGFSLLLYGDSRHLAGFGAESAAYVVEMHAVLGAVMVGWGVALFLVIRGPFTRGEPLGWRIIALSLVAWFVPDTVFSLGAGFWQNAVLNCVFLVLFSIPLAATGGAFRSRRS